MWVEDPATGAIRYTTSVDGKAWVGLQATSLDGNAGNMAHEFCIIKDGATYKMWYNSLPVGPVGTASYRTSADGLTWSAATLVTFVSGGQAWDVDYIAPMVIKDGSTYKMWYNATEGNGKYYFAYATSTNGTTFTEPQNLGKIISNAGNTNNNLVLKQGDAGTWEGYQTGEALYSNVVLKNSDGVYEMWYAANKNGQAGGANGYKIGYASSSDGISWTKSSGNPVLGGGGTTGGFDDNGVFYPTVIQDGDTYKMWYWPYTNWQGGVGYATANKVVTQATATPTASSETVQVAAEALPETGGSSGNNNVVVLISLTLLTVSISAFYLLKRKIAKS
jgi:LPXTG-motif cell wall-anchored protein